MSIFSHVDMAPSDPILGLVETFNKDERQGKTNLSIGVYTDADGKVPVLKAVQKAQAALANKVTPATYLPIDGIKNYSMAVQKLLFGPDHPLVVNKFIATIQSLGGTGALKIGADFLYHFFPKSTVYVSNPTWDNHRALFQGAGFEVKDYPYFDQAKNGVDFDAMVAFLNTLKTNDIVLLHACCHNPTGADLTPAQWDTLIEVIKVRGLIPFLDMAYQGFSKGVEEDSIAIRKFAEQGVATLVASSFSKSFSLYGERVGALSVVTDSEAEALCVQSQLKKMVRANYSSPPTTGAALVNHVLNDAELCALWQEELGQMRLRIKSMREQLTRLLNEGQTKRDFSFINYQAGMFSYTGLSKEEVNALRDRFGVYAVGTGRICIAALNAHNIEVAAEAIIKVI